MEKNKKIFRIFFHFRKFLAFLAKFFFTFMTLTSHPNSPKVMIGFPENLPSAADIPVSTDTLVYVSHHFSAHQYIRTTDAFLVLPFL